MYSYILLQLCFGKEWYQMQKEGGAPPSGSDENTEAGTTTTMTEQ